MKKCCVLGALIILIMAERGTSQSCSEVWFSWSDTNPYDMASIICGTVPWNDTFTIYAWGFVECPWDGIGAMNLAVRFNTDCLEFITADIAPAWQDFLFYGVDCPDPDLCDYGYQFPDKILWYAAVCIDSLGCYPPPYIGEPVLIGSVTFRLVSCPFYYDTIAIDTCTYPPVNFTLFGDQTGQYMDIPEWTSVILCIPSEAKEKEGTPGEFYLKAIEPNPLRSTSTISYGLPAQSSVSITVFDTRGRMVKELYHGIQGPGNYTLQWDGRDQQGRLLTSGIYFIKMEAGAFRSVKRLLILR
jgi:hypothetical protein